MNFARSINAIRAFYIRLLIFCKREQVQVLHDSRPFGWYALVGVATPD